MRSILIAIGFFFTSSAFAAELKCDYRSKTAEGRMDSKSFTVDHDEYLEFPIDEKKSRVVSYGTDPELPEGLNQIVTIMDIDRNHAKFSTLTDLKASQSTIYRWLVGNVTEKGVVFYSFTEDASRHTDHIKLYCTF